MDSKPLNVHHEPAQIAALSSSASQFLDLVRVFATNLVLINHTSDIFGLSLKVPLGHLGVVLFFLLSGFLITIAGYRRLFRPGRQFLDFMLDRCARIFVPLIPVLVAVATANWLFELTQRGQLGINRGPVAFLANLLLLNDHPIFQVLSKGVDMSAAYPRSYNAAEQLWTIPIEFWTYVVFATFLFVQLKGERLPSPLLVIVAVIALPVFLWNSFAGGSGVLSLTWILGAVVACLWLTVPSLAPRLTAVGFSCCGLGVIGLLGRGLKVGHDPYEFQQVAFIALLLFGLLALTQGSQVLRGGHVMSRLASYSYSLYLTHNTVLVVFKEKLNDVFGTMNPTAAVVSSHIVAIGFYIAFESRYHEVGKWLKSRAPARSYTVSSA